MKKLYKNKNNIKNHTKIYEKGQAEQARTHPEHIPNKRPNKPEQCPNKFRTTSTPKML